MNGEVNEDRGSILSRLKLKESSSPEPRSQPMKVIRVKKQDDADSSWKHDMAPRVILRRPPAVRSLGGGDSGDASGGSNAVIVRNLGDSVTLAKVKELVGPC